VKKLKKIGATSEETANPLRRGLAQIAGNKRKETEDGRYYVPCEDKK